ncbi:MAG: isochorismatase family cysteine hydrolase [Brevinematales bacterium]|jgi:nicotinamidase-related amidase
MNNSALLVMDVQPETLNRLEKDQGGAYIKKVRGAVDAAHNKDIPVIYVVLGFRPDFPEINPRNKTFSQIKERPLEGMVNPAPAIEPSGKDIVVTKRRVSAFTGSDLDVVLRSLDIRHLVLAGIATSGVVLSTTREAADKDYQLTILSDLCLDFDPDVHKILMEKIFPRQASVITGEEWIKSL